ncbi:DUF748 domain-containing protein [Bdellovibrio svalbardensis]|uniref:DUF748 domain-containing protein n=1 Tax=Bdellovibrio svalbardensis TaxID=2972972 RepID=A0ABT6DK45_9BACT|nr:DUF748 domain-containing protein [Bdellovibrio svalbardensis]MDG0816289.1 DUF748 domain-containing protein [Bdellovibrio svalbardensis]
MILKFASATIQKIAFGFAGFIALYALLGFFVVPYVVKQEAVKTVESKFGVKPEIKKISFNPFIFELTVEGFEMPAAVGTDSSQSRLKFDLFSLNMSIFPLLKKEIHLSSVILKNAQLQFIILSNGTTNWVVKEDKNKKPEAPFDWILNFEHIQIEKSGLDFIDRTHVSPLELPLGPISLQASNISTSLGANTDLNSLLISVGDKGHVKINGSLRMKPFSAAVHLDVAEFPLDFVTAYLSDKTLLSLKKGNIDILGNVKYEKGNVLFEGSSQVNDLSLEEKG